MKGMRRMRLLDSLKDGKCIIPVSPSADANKTLFVVCWMESCCGNPIANRMEREGRDLKCRIDNTPQMLLSTDLLPSTTAKYKNVRPMSQCKKVGYPNRKEAKAAIARHNKSPYAKKKAKSEYRCPYCGEFHITTMNESERKMDREFHKQRAAEQR